MPGSWSNSHRNLVTHTSYTHCCRGIPALLVATLESLDLPTWKVAPILLSNMESEESMTDETAPNRVGAQEAREALKSVSEMRAAAVRWGVPPRWLGALIAALIASIFAAMAADDNQVVIGFWGVLLAVTAAVKRRRLGLLARNMRLRMTPLLVAGQLTAVAAFVGVVVAAQWFGLRYGLRWAPLVGGLGGGLVFYGLFEFKRRMIRRSIEAEFDA